MKRIKNTKVGDVFVVQLDGGKKKFFQYIISDLTQLNSDVIRAFKSVYPAHTQPSLQEIISDEVDFYAHCITKAGIEMGLWTVAGNTADTGQTDHILFRDSSDYGTPEVKTSERWWVWKINEAFEYIGKLTDKYQHAEIGVVVTPKDIVERIEKGKYTFQFPGY